MAPSNAEWKLLMARVPSRATSSHHGDLQDAAPSSPATPIPQQFSQRRSSANLPLRPESSISSILTQKTLGFITACNAHNFDPDHPFYKQTFSPHYKYRGRVLLGEETSVSLEAWLRTQQAVWVRNPEYFVRVVSLDVDVIDVQKGQAQVFVHMELLNVPRGVVRGSILVSEWRRVKERWVCVWTKVVPGMDVREQGVASAG